MKIPEEKITEAYVRLIDLADKEIIIISNNLGEMSNLQVMEALREKANARASLVEHYTKGEDLAVHGRYSDAIKELKMAEKIIVNPCKFSSDVLNFLGVLYNNLGFCHLKIGNFSEAKAYLEKSRENALNAVFTNNNLGETYEALGQTESAIRAYQRELAINPKHPTAKQSLEKLLIKN